MVMMEKPFTKAAIPSATLKTMTERHVSTCLKLIYSKTLKLLQTIGDAETSEDDCLDVKGDINE